MIKLNKIYNEDCLDTMSRMDDCSVDLIVTSPPYEDLRKYNGFSFDFNSVAESMYRVLKDSGVAIWIVNDKRKNGNRTLTHFRQAIKFQDVGFNVLDVMIWKKSNPMPFVQRDQYTPSYEIMLVLVKGKVSVFNPIMEKCKYAGKVIKTHTSNKESIRKANLTSKTKDTKIKSNVWETVVAGTNHGHPAIFPESLVRDHIFSWSNEGDLVYDPFIGSGTVAKVCLDTNRKYIGSETSSEYCEICRNRIS